MKAYDIECETDGADADLPTEIEIPEGMTDEEEISDYLSNMVGFLHKGFCLTE